MTFASSSRVLLLGLTLLLSACGGGTPPPGNITPEPPATGVTRTFKVDAQSPQAALRSGDALTVPVRLTAQNGFTGPVTVELVDAPAGVSAAPVTATLGDTATVTLNVTTTAQTAGLLNLKVRATAGGTVVTDDAFAFVYRVTTLPTGDTNCPTCRFPGEQTVVTPDRVWMLGAPQTTANDTIVSVDRATDIARAHPLPLDIYDRAAALAVSAGLVWVAIDTMGSASPSLLSLNPDTGETQRHIVGTTGSQSLFGLAALPDGRLAFLHRTNTYPPVDAVGVFDPRTGTSRLTTLPRFAQDLAVAPDGGIWTAQSYASPALVRIDPDSGDVREYGIGEERKNLAGSITVTQDGRVWYQDVWAHKFGVLNPSTGQITQYAGSLDSGHLTAQGNTVFFARPAQAGAGGGVSLLDVDGDQLAQLPLPTLKGVHDDMDAFGMGADGTLAYESSGELYLLPID